MDWTKFAQYGSEVIIVGGFLSFLIMERKDCKVCRAEQKEIVSNHMNHQEDATRQLAKAIDGLKETIDRKM